MSLGIQPNDSPLAALRRWYREAEEALPLDQAHTMTLATVGPRGRPSARIVLCRDVTSSGGLVFYTNYESRKARELEASPAAAAVFHWWHFRRQIRVEGIVGRTPREVSDGYWAARPRESQISALVSPQSRPVDGHAALEEQRTRLRAQYEGQGIERPAYWGGYHLEPTAIEFWMAGDARLHERLRFESIDGTWHGQWLAP